MDRKKSAMMIASLAAVAVAVTAGVGAREARADRMRRLSAAAAFGDRLPPAVVIAERPTLSDVLDLILHDRPTAAELGKAAVPHSGFPQGSDEAHVATILGKYTSDPERANRIAGAIVKEGRRRNVGSSLLIGVLLTENPWLDPRARSSVGARGLMQVMPFHSGKWGCPSGDLFDIESNICHGVAVLADNLARSRSLPQALLGYNGCVRGTNTPDCWKYPTVVYRHARKGIDDGPATTRPFSAQASQSRKPPSTP